MYVISVTIGFSLNRMVEHNKIRICAHGLNLVSRFFNYTGVAHCVSPHPDSSERKEGAERGEK